MKKSIFIAACALILSAGIANAAPGHRQEVKKQAKEQAADLKDKKKDKKEVKADNKQLKTDEKAGTTAAVKKDRKEDKNAIWKKTSGQHLLI